MKKEIRSTEGAIYYLLGHQNKRGGVFVKDAKNKQILLKFQDGKLVLDNKNYVDQILKHKHYKGQVNLLKEIKTVLPIDKMSKEQLCEFAKARGKNIDRGPKASIHLLRRLAKICLKEGR
jgi:hypothetical protein